MSEREPDKTPSMQDSTAEAAADSSYQPGFVEWWLRRCGERPWSCFLRLWVVFLIATILLSFGGFSHQSVDAQPPDPRSIPYADWLRGGAAEEEGTIDLRAEDLPEYDQSLRSNRIGLTLRPSPDNPNENRLMAWRARYIGTLGWPWLAVSWSSQIHWDVTDPRAPFPPMPQVQDPGLKAMWHSRSLGFTWWHEQGAVAFTIGLYAPGILLQIAAPQLLAGIVVLTSALIHGTQRRRRRFGGHCLLCGHGLDPSRSSERCPECGSQPPSRERDHAANRRTILQRPARLSICLFLFLILGWLLMQPVYWMSGTEMPVHQALAERPDVGRVYTHRIIERWWQGGWPMMVIYGQVEHCFTMTPGEGARWTSAPAAPRLEWQFEHIVLRLGDHRPHVTTLITIDWAAILTPIALLHIVATILAITIAAMSSLRSRWGGNPQGALSPSPRP
jgi:hypothetical protein